MYNASMYNASICLLRIYELNRVHFHEQKNGVTPPTHSYPGGYPP